MGGATRPDLRNVLGIGRRVEHVHDYEYEHDSGCGTAHPAPMPRTYDTCPKCRAFIEPGAPECPYCGTVLRVRRAGLGARIAKHPVSHALLGVILVVFAAEVWVDAMEGMGRGRLSGLVQPSLLTLDRLGANHYPLNILEGEWWRFLTAIFLHIGALHLLFNGWALLTLAPLCEEIYGRARFLAVYLATGLAGNLVSYAWYGHTFGVQAGASGALCGLIGLLMVFRLGQGWDAGAELIRRTTTQWLIQTILFGLLVGADNAAHLGGAAAGLILGLLLGRRSVRRGRAWELLVWRPAAVGLAAAAVVSFGAMIASQRAWAAVPEVLDFERDLRAMLDEQGRLAAAPDMDATARDRMAASLRAMAARPLRDPKTAAARDAIVRAGTQIAAGKDAWREFREAVMAYMDDKETFEDIYRRAKRAGT